MQLVHSGSEHGSFVGNNGSKMWVNNDRFVLYVLIHSVNEELEEVKKEIPLFLIIDHCSDMNRMHSYVD